MEYKRPLELNRMSNNLHPSSGSVYEPGLLGPHLIFVTGPMFVLNTRISFLKPGQSQEQVQCILKYFCLVGCFWGFTSFQRYFSHILTLKQEITNLWNRSGETGTRTPGPLLRKPRAEPLHHRWPLKYLPQHGNEYIASFGRIPSFSRNTYMTPVVDWQTS